MKVDRKPEAIRQLEPYDAYTFAIKSFASDETWEG